MNKDQQLNSKEMKQEFIWFSEKQQGFHVTKKADLTMGEDWDLLSDKIDADLIHWFTYFSRTHFLHKKRTTDFMRANFMVFLAGWLRENQDEYFPKE